MAEQQGMYTEHEAKRACREAGINPDAMREDPAVPARFWEPNWAYMLRELNDKTKAFYDEAIATPNPTSEKDDGTA